MFLLYCTNVWRSASLVPTGLESGLLVWLGLLLKHTFQKYFLFSLGQPPLEVFQRTPIK